MREIKPQIVVNAVRDMCIQSNCILSKDVLKSIKDALHAEQSPIGKDILEKMRKILEKSCSSAHSSKPVNQ